jgi:hypothetical protein
MNRFLSFALGLLAAATCLESAIADKTDIQEERPRLLLIFAPDTDSKVLKQQYDALEADAAEVNDEDVNVVYVIGDRGVKMPPPDAKTMTADEVRKRYHVDATAFKVVLVGRDGWQKARWSEPTDPHVIIGRAADMPKPKSKDEDQKR